MIDEKSIKELKKFIKNEFDNLENSIIPKLISKEAERIWKRVNFNLALSCIAIGFCFSNIICLFVCLK